MISALSWMPRGKAKAVPNRFQPSEEEMEEMRAAAADLEDNNDDDDEWEDMTDDDEEEKAGAKASAVKHAVKAAKAAAKSGDKSKKGKVGNADELAEYKLDDYDDEPAELSGILSRGLQVYRDNQDDPYITLPDAEDNSEDDDDTLIRPTDALILACHAQETGFTLDVYVYDDQEGSLFVHHDLMLNAYPLCVTWLDTARSDGTVGSFAAIGTMDTEIEVWDLDCIDNMEPVAVLGGEDLEASVGAAGTGKKKKKKAKKTLREGSHSDAVLGMCWHHLQRNIIASASADHTVKIWDVPQEKCLHTLSHHKDKVQAVQWHPTEAAVLLTGSFDKNASVLDVRATAADWKAAGKWAVSSDIENVVWDPFNTHQFLVSTDDGNVFCHDARKQGQGPLFTIGAHTEACTGLALSTQVPGLLATASLDKTVKLWDIKGGKVAYVDSKPMEIGQVFCASFCTERGSEYILAAGGKDSKVLIWDTASSAAVRARFPTGKSDEDYLGVEDLEMDKMNITRDDDRDSDDSATDSEEEKKPRSVKKEELDDDGEEGPSQAQAKTVKKKKKKAKK